MDAAECGEILGICGISVIERVHWVEKCVRTADNGAVWVKYQ